ncbi:MAG TPA: HPr family phosphocarrier protein [Candidatus Limousia pullorum]|uniref:HPr family phosphocarrier protein n=1 Tax=Candidatus Limousia pullorum TaxID=2840860 RepID=A0A9D1LZC7_9FIRM|nr:HPr family phosphocarrier protein [Candidatus Limousia pullorum]
MMNFNYIIKDEMGIHARPAGLLVKLVKSQDSKVTITKGEKTVDASKIFAVMGLAVKCGEEIIITVDGGTDENKNLMTIKEFVMNNL